MTDVASASWDPGQYLRFGDHRSRPALELLSRVHVERPADVWDLGCGTGEGTRLLAERWPEARVRGLDSSPSMLARAAASDAGRGSDPEWIEARIEDWRPDGPVSVLYSNAALHWVGDHEHVFPRLFDALAPGGCLAVQMPLSFDQPSHRLMRETLGDAGPGGTPVGTEALRRAMDRRWVGTPEDYFGFLVDRARHVDVWTTEVLQVLHGDEPVFEWVQGTGLRPILEGLEGDERTAFLERYRARLRAAYPARADGHVLFPFRRLFVVATARSERG